MSYLALARKWRPTTFAEVVGQTHVLTALENALDQNRLHHAYLFSGTRGVGKTTIGRLLAKGLNCEKGITSHPCGECSICKEIDQGRFVDLLEIDAASRTKVEDTRELLDNVQYKPARGRFKVYLIDEVHMLSRHSFNALLKTLEEPPEYVKFLLATTDPQKLPVTILSRCLQFHLKPISVENIEHQLDYILNQESVEFEERALSLLAHAADGSMRDALSLSDQAIALGNGKVTVDHVSLMLGTIDTDQALHILTALSHNQPSLIMNLLDTLAKNGVDWDALLKSLCEQLHRLAMCQALPHSNTTDSPDEEKIQQLSQAISPEEIQLYYQIALKGRKDLSLAPTPKIGLEMVLLRMVAFRPAEVSPLHEMKLSQPPSTKAMQVQPTVSVAPVIPSMSQSVSTNVEIIHDGLPEKSEPEKNQEQESVLSTPSPNAVDERVNHSSISGLRHQLRSQRHSTSKNEMESVGKKSKAVSKDESVFERLANISTQNSTEIPHQNHQEKAQSIATEQDEAYRWTPMLDDDLEEECNHQLTPSELKLAVEHEKTPEMTEKLIGDVMDKDKWARLIHNMELPKLVEQLALNSVFIREGSEVKLILRANQQHLRTEKAHEELQYAISNAIGEPCQLYIDIGEEGKTPLELREISYQERWNQAYQSLQQDSTVQFIETRFRAELDKETVRPI